MASKSSPRHTKHGKVSAHDVLVTKRKRSKQSSTNKALTRRASPVIKKNKTPREEHHSGSNEPGSLSYYRDINNTAGFRSSNKRASPAITNDITQTKRESRNKVKMSPASVDVNPKESPANIKTCALPQSISKMKAFGKHPKSDSKAEPKYNNLDSVERKNGTLENLLSAETEKYSSPPPTRNNSANNVTDTSKNYSVTHRNTISPVSNAAVQRTNFETRGSSALCRTDASSRSSSAIYNKGSPSRSYSAGFRTTTSPKSNFGLFSINTLSGSSSSIRRSNTPSRKMVKFKKDEKNKELSRQASCDQEIIEGKGIEIKANKYLESLISEEMTKDNEKIKKIEVFIRPSAPLPEDLPETNRAELQSRGSSLMLGSGKTRRQNDTETLEIHFNKKDYSNLVTKSSPEMYCITGNLNSDNAQNEGKQSPRHVEVQLPKTYITKSGSLFLYSDGTVMKDKQRERSENSQGSGQSIEILGHKMSPRTLVPQAYPYWGKLIKTKTGDKRNNTGTYISLENKPVYNDVILYSILLQINLITFYVLPDFVLNFILTIYSGN